MLSVSPTNRNGLPNPTTDFRSGTAVENAHTRQGVRMELKTRSFCPECRFRISRFALRCRHCKRETAFSRLAHVLFYSAAIIAILVLGILALTLNS